MTPLLTPKKESMGELFSEKKIAWREQRVWANLWGMFWMGNNDPIMQGVRKSFTNAFSSNLCTKNLKIFPDHGRRHT